MRPLERILDDQIDPGFIVAHEMDREKPPEVRDVQEPAGRVRQGGPQAAVPIEVLTPGSRAG
jgi:hypothetical protein